MKTKIIFFSVLFIITNYTFGQGNENYFDINRNITLNGMEKTKEIILKVNPETKGIRFNIDCYLSVNELSIEIVDPNGKKVGSFSIESQIKSNDEKTVSNEDIYNVLISSNQEYSESVNGKINKLVRSIPGKWKIVIKPTNPVNAKIQISTRQFSEL